MRRGRADIKKGNVPKPKDGRRFRLLCGRGVERRTHKLVGEENGITNSFLVDSILRTMHDSSVVCLWLPMFGGVLKGQATGVLRG